MSELGTLLRAAGGNGRSLTGVVSEGLAIATGRSTTERSPPPHLADQGRLIHDWFDTDETRWLVFFDAGRYDFFDQLVWDYFDGDLKRAWNGGVGYTGDWMARNLSFDFGNRGVFTDLPFRELQHVDYDESDWFAYAPDLRQDEPVKQRLAELGYLERENASTIKISTNRINRAVLNVKDELNGGVIRYLKPHPPFAGLEDLTSESTKTAKTRAAIENGDLSYEELTKAYIDTYRTGFEAAKELVAELDGRVILTSDHGTCLTCGQLFHGRALEKHDHLTIMPWFEVDKLV